MTASVQVVTVGLADAVPDGGALLDAALAGSGLTLAGRLATEDDEALLEHGLRAEVALTVILTGPPGSSAAEIVRRVAARATGARLVLSEPMLAALGPASADRAALLPQGAVVWTAPEAPAAGWVFERDARTFVVLPVGVGLPSLVQRHLRPLLDARRTSTISPPVRRLRCAGVSVGEVERRLAPLLRDDEVRVSVLGVDGDVLVCLRTHRAGPAASGGIDGMETRVLALLGPDFYGRDAESLEHLIGQTLIDRGLIVATAESCTGGLVGHRLTNVAGSSAWFERGVVVYSNRAKQELLGVPESVLREHGAVSAPCAEAMARGVCAMSGAGCGLSITGIAGPDGGTPAKPVGTVFVGIVAGGDALAHRFHFSGDRQSIKWQSSQAALDLLRRHLQFGPPSR